MKINSVNNSRVKQWMKLKKKKYRDEYQEYLVEGDHLVEEALNKIARHTQKLRILGTYKQS